MYKLEFTLKQHTPIIHFQHDQDGATLRATEVKPKLDRFIIIKFGGFESLKKEHPDWFIGKGNHPALSYKMRIDVDENNLDKTISGPIEKRYKDNKGNIRNEKFPAFFGLMGGDNEGSKEFRFYKKVELNCISASQSLIRILTENIGEFFACNNFGNRQSKGFGSFYPEDQKRFPFTPLKYYFDIQVRNLPNVRYNYLDPLTESFRQQVRLFEVINLFYNTLRSGINQSWGQNPIYFKSLMFMYAKNQLKVQWDKKKIKEAVFDMKLAEQKNKYRNSDIIHFSAPKSYLMRDLLGLASDSQWFGEYHDAIHTESLEREKIERFQSPIFFKPIEQNNGKYRVYFKGDQKNLNEMLGKKFKISNKSGKSLELYTPTNFNLDDFLQYAFSIKIDEHISQKGNGFSPEKELLMNIYSQLRMNS